VSDGVGLKLVTDGEVVLAVGLEVPADGEVVLAVGLEVPADGFWHIGLVQPVIVPPEVYFAIIESIPALAERYPEPTTTRPPSDVWTIALPLSKPESVSFIAFQTSEPLELYLISTVSVAVP
jgi:hypothetical protein